MAIIARPGPVFYVFGPKISRTFWGKCTEQSSRKKLAVGGFEPEKVRLLYPAPLKASLLSTTIKVRFLQYFIQNERKSSKIRVIQGLGVVNWTAPRPFFRFQSRKIAKNAGWGCCNRINNGRAVCDSHHVNEDVLEAAYLTAMRRLVDSAEEVVEAVRDGAELALEPENKAAMDRIDEETIQLQEAALALHKAKQRMEIGSVEYASRVKEYSERMKELEAERNELQGTAAKYAEVRLWLDTFIEQTMQSDTLTTVDGTTMKILVDRIHVRNDGVAVEFKCGVAIEQEYVK